MKKLLIIFLVATLQSCGKVTSPLQESAENIVDTLVYADSLNFPDNMYYSSRDTARVYKAIQDYFTPKGYYPEEKMTLDTLLTHYIEPEPQCVEFDNLYLLGLNDDNIDDYLVTYFKMPCGASGNQWRPHLAIVTSFNGGKNRLNGGKLRLVSEDLLPDYWSHIDSVRSNRQKVFIYGKIFDRGSQEFTKNYRATIIKI